MNGAAEQFASKVLCAYVFGAIAVLLLSGGSWELGKRGNHEICRIHLYRRAGIYQLSPPGGKPTSQTEGNTKTAVLSSQW